MGGGDGNVVVVGFMQVSADTKLFFLFNFCKEHISYLFIVKKNFLIFLKI